jgi:pimeloyl-ACP methyl ester carboxylesterase
VTAALLGDRVDRAAVGSGLGPMGAVGLRERLWYYGARYVSPLSKLALWRLMGRAVDDREASLERLAEAGSPADEPLWTGEVGQILHASMVEARRVHGIDPLVTETALLGSPWGFDLADVDVPVGLWYGKADAIVPVRMGLHLTEHLPTAETHVYPDLGHLSAVEHNEDAIFEWLSR